MSELQFNNAADMRAHYAAIKSKFMSLPPGPPDTVRFVTRERPRSVKPKQRVIRILRRREERMFRALPPRPVKHKAGPVLDEVAVQNTKSALNVLATVRFGKANVDHVMGAVAASFGMAVDVLYQRDRWRSIAQARHIAVGLAKLVTGKSWNEIGRILGRDHTTMLHSGAMARRTIEAALGREVDYCSTLCIS